LESPLIPERKTKDQADERDRLIGQRLRMRRNFLGLSQDKLGKAVGLTFQQVQKYERGLNKISAARLIDFSSILDVPITYFFAGLSNIGEKTPEFLLAADNDQDKLEDVPLVSKESLELLKNFHAIKNHDTRKAVLRLVRQMAEAPDQPL
jgi:transcriptional regulator with XRE-family HTH domain